MKIDAHQHFWKFDPVRDAWIDDSMEAIRRDFMPQDLELKLKKTGFDGCVSVQADQSEEETHFLLDLAENHEFIKGVVGWTDLKSLKIDERLNYFSQFPKLKGFRHIMQAEPAGFMTDKLFLNGIKKLADFNFSYDILIYENQLEECLQMVQNLPDMNLVIDHAAKPNIKENSFENWQKFMEKLAAFPHVHVKLSGMVTEADWNDWEYSDLEPYLETCLQQFGTDRLMIGSDWPVCLLAAEYGEVIEIVENFMSGLSRDEQGAILGNTAVNFYRLK